MADATQRALVPVAAAHVGSPVERTESSTEILEATISEDAGDATQDVIDRWLAAAARKSGSERTAPTYRALLADYRGWLNTRGLDLTSDPRTLAEELGAWSIRPRRRDGAPVSDATRALRIAAVGSFYSFALEDVIIRHDSQETQDSPDRAAPLPFAALRSLNPARLKTLVERPKPARKPVYGLDRAEAAAAISALDAATPTGKRDLAFLALALTCGRRISELRGLQLGDVHDSGGWTLGAITVTWRRTKGHPDGADNLLGPEAIAALRTWLAELRHLAARGGVTLTEQSTVWPRLDPATKGSLDVTRPVGYTGLQRLYDRHLGITKTHRGRHSFAIALLEDNASMVEIMEALGHSNLATTTTYMRQVKQGLQKDTHASAIARAFGFRAVDAQGL